MCVAVCRSVLQCQWLRLKIAERVGTAAVAVSLCYSVSQCAAECCSALQCIAVCCSASQSVAVCCICVRTVDIALGLHV